MISDVGFAWAFQVYPSSGQCFLPTPWKAIHSVQWTAHSKKYKPNFGQISLTSKSTSLQQIASKTAQFSLFGDFFHISVSSQSPKYVLHLFHNFCLCSWRNPNCTSQNELPLQIFLLDIFVLFLRALLVLSVIHLISPCCSWWWSFTKDTISSESGKQKLFSVWFVIYNPPLVFLLPQNPVGFKVH